MKRAYIVMEKIDMEYHAPIAVIQTALTEADAIKIAKYNGYNVDAYGRYYLHIDDVKILD